MRWWGWAGGAMALGAALGGFWLALGRRSESAAEAEEIAGLGTLSQKYETGTEDGAAAAGVVSTGEGDAGGISYGAYQFATNTGSAARFVEWLGRYYAAYGKKLAGLEPGTTAFSAAWRSLALTDGPGFFEAQHKHVGELFYVPACEGVADELGLDVRKRSQALRDVLWSTAVQHGPEGAVSVWKVGIAGANPNALDDAALIRAVYQERGRRDFAGLVHFRPAVRRCRRAWPAGTRARRRAPSGASTQRASSPPEVVRSTLGHGSGQPSTRSAT